MDDIQLGEQLPPALAPDGVTAPALAWAGDGGSQALARADLSSQLEVNGA